MFSLYFSVTCLRMFFALFLTGDLNAFLLVNIIKRGIIPHPESSGVLQLGTKKDKEPSLKPAKIPP